MFCVMFVICQLKFEHLNMRKPMELPINVLCDVCDLSIKIYAQILIDKYHTRHLLAMPLVFSCSNAQILIDKSQTSHKTFIGNAIDFLIFKCSNL
jgi:hypothetical protein